MLNMKFTGVAAVLWVVTKTHAFAAIDSAQCVAWVERNPLPTSQDLVDAVRFDGRYYLAGGTGVLMRSQDGESWTNLGVQLGNQTHFQVHQNALYAVSDNRLYRVESDQVFPLGDIPSVIQVNTVFSDGERLFVGGRQANGFYYRSILISTMDLEQWTEHDVAVENWDFGSEITAMAQRGQDYMVVNKYGHVLLSNNGADWVVGGWLQPEIGSSARIRSISVFQGDFYLVGVSQTLVPLGPDKVRHLIRTGDGIEFDLLLNETTYTGGFTDTTVVNDTLFVTDQAGRLYTLDATGQLNFMEIGDEEINTLASDGNNLVLAGDHGSVYLGFDGQVDWQNQRTGTTVNFSGASRVDDEFVAVSTDGSIHQSVQGIDWTERFMDSSYEFKDVVSLGQQALAIGDEGLTLTFDTSGEQYEQVGDDVIDWSAISRLDDKLAMVSSNGHLATRMMNSAWIVEPPQSSDLRADNISLGEESVLISDSGKFHVRTQNDSWIRFEPIKRGFKDVAYNGNQFAVLIYDGTLYTSGDARIWSSRDTNLQDLLLQTGATGVNGIQFVNSTWYVTGRDGFVARSQDLTNWESVPVPATPVSVFGVVPVGNQLIVHSALDDLFVSSNGTDWTSLDTPVDNPIYNLTSHDHGYHIVTNFPSRVFHSLDGMNWSAVDLPVLNSEFLSLRAAESGNGITLIAGSVRDEAADNQWRTVSYVSTNGVDWQRIDTALENRLDSISFFNGNFFAFSGNRLFSSRDGTYWADLGIKQELEGTFRSQVLETLMFAHGANRISTTLDGEDWLDLNDETSNQRFTGTVWNGVEHVLFGAREEVIDTSFNVIVREEFVTRVDESGRFEMRSLPELPKLDGVTFTDGDYLVWSQTGELFHSSDLDHWTSLPRIPVNNRFSHTRALKDVMISGDQVIAVGDHGAIASMSCRDQRVFEDGFE